MLSRISSSVIVGAGGRRGRPSTRRSAACASFVLLRRGRVMTVAIDDHASASLQMRHRRGGRMASGIGHVVFGADAHDERDDRRRRRRNAAIVSSASLKLPVALRTRPMLHGPTSPPNCAMVLMSAIVAAPGRAGAERRCEAPEQRIACVDEQARHAQRTRRQSPDSAHRRCLRWPARSCRRRKRDASSGRRCGPSCG